MSIASRIVFRIKHSVYYSVDRYSLTKHASHARMSSNESAPIETSFLIVGAGPAGASLASFLASYGLHGIVVSAAAGTAKEPRAHITNAAALECLRDIGLEEEAKKNATPGDCEFDIYFGVKKELANNHLLPS